MRRSALFFRLLTLLLWAVTALSAWRSEASMLMIDPQEQLSYAEQLFKEGRLRQAAEEYERFAFFFPEHPERRLVLFNAGRAYMLAGDGVAALQNFNKLIENDALDPLAVDAYFMMAETYVLIENPNRAVLQLTNLIALTDDTAVKDRAYLRIGWIQIEQMDWSRAKHAWGRVSPEGRQKHGVDALETALAQGEQLPLKNPTLSGLLSIVPGAGQLYCGRYQDALAALLVNGGLFWAAYESFDQDLNALGSLLSVAALGFYTANIYGAVSSAHKYNQTQKQRFIEQLKQNVIFRIEPTVSPSGVSAGALVVRWTIIF